jgi:uncharacterized protein YndB with AHSA1/START domain
MLFYPDSFKVSTPTDSSIAMERDFNAPRELVFDAFTKPELVRRWFLGPDGWTMPVCNIDLKVGGNYRYVWRKETGTEEMTLDGVFREVIRPKKLVAPEKFASAWGSVEAVYTRVFEENGDITKVMVTVLFQSKEVRDATKFGMQQGVAAAYDRLEQALSSMRSY